MPRSTGLMLLFLVLLATSLFPFHNSSCCCVLAAEDSNADDSNTLDGATPSSHHDGAQQDGHEAHYHDGHHSTEEEGTSSGRSSDGKGRRVNSADYSDPTQRLEFQAEDIAEQCVSRLGLARTVAEGTSLTARQVVVQGRRAATSLSPYNRLYYHLKGDVLMLLSAQAKLKVAVSATRTSTAENALRKLNQCLWTMEKILGVQFMEHIQDATSDPRAVPVAPSAREGGLASFVLGRNRKKSPSAPPYPSPHYERVVEELKAVHELGSWREGLHVLRGGFSEEEDEAEDEAEGHLMEEDDEAFD